MRQVGLFHVKQFSACLAWCCTHLSSLIFPAHLLQESSMTSPITGCPRGTRSSDRLVVCGADASASSAFPFDQVAFHNDVTLHANRMGFFPYSYHPAEESRHVTGYHLVSRETANRRSCGVPSCTVQSLNASCESPNPSLQGMIAKPSSLPLTHHRFVSASREHAKREPFPVPSLADHACQISHPPDPLFARLPCAYSWIISFGMSHACPP